MLLLQRDDFFSLFFLVFVDVGKCNLMTLIFNDIVMSILAFFHLFMRPNTEDSVDGNAFFPLVCWFLRSSINFTKFVFAQHESHYHVAISGVFFSLGYLTFH